MKFTPEQVIEMARAAIDKDKTHAYSGFWTLTEDELTRLCALAADRALEAAAQKCDDNEFADGAECAQFIRAMKEQQ